MIRLEDVRGAAARWRRSRATAAAIVFMIALGGGASGLAVALITGLLGNPLNAKSPDRLVALGEAYPSLAGDLKEAPAFLDYAPLLGGFERLAAYSEHDGAATFTVDGVMTRARGAEVTSGFFETLEVPLDSGRHIAPGELASGRNRVVIVGTSLAAVLFGDASKAVGRRVQINDIPFDVIGVAPGGFRFPQGASFWIPISLNRDRVFTSQAVSYALFGRLAAGVSIDAAREELKAFPARAAAVAPDSWPTRRKIVLRSLSDVVVGESARSIQLLAGALLLVWLATVANVGMLLVTRNATRSTELAIRWALGASRRRFLRDFIIEALVLVAVSGAIASAAVYAGLGVIDGLLPDHFGGSFMAAPTALSLTAVWTIALMAGVLVVVPALRWNNRAAHAHMALREGGRAPSALRGRRLAAAAQAAVATLLIVATFTLARTIRELHTSDLGFNAGDSIAFSVSVPGYAGTPNAVPPDVWTSVLERVRGVRGVTAAGAATGVPMIRTDAIGLLYSVVGERSPKAFQDRFALTVAVTPGYFEAIGFRMLEGRVFDERDMSTPAPVAIVSRALADRFGGPSKILGKQLTLAGQPSAASIVGIAENVRHFGPETAVPAQVYVPHRHMPAQLAAIVVRHTGDAGATAREIRGAAGSANEFVIYDLRPMPDVVRAATQPQHLLAWVLIVFAAIALSLAGVATYAVTAQFIATRTREIAVRRALGAPRSTVMRLLMANGLLPAALGAVGGLLATFAALRALASVLPGMRAPVAIDSGAAVLTVLLMAAAACALSSTIAFRIDPAQALRE